MSEDPASANELTAWLQQRGHTAEEIEKIFYKSWLFACRAEEVPEIGDYKLFSVEDENLIIVRNKEGQIKCLFNVCRHRGTQLCTEAQGSFKSKSRVRSSRR